MRRDDPTAGTTHTASIGRSWTDLLTTWIERLPGPTWLSYVAIGLLLTALQVLMITGSGRSVGPFAVYFAVAGVYAVALLHYLRLAAATAFNRFRPALAPAHEDRADVLRSQLTGLPAGATAAASAGAAAIALATLAASGPIDQQLRGAGLPTSPGGAAFNLALYVFNWAATGALLYRIAYQSRQINRLYGHARVELFRPTPLHAFSWLGARSVIGLALMFYAPALLFPEAGNPVLWTLVRLSIGALLAFIFVWPLLGVHGLLAAEQARLLARSHGRSQAFYEEMHERLGKDERGISEAAKTEIDTLEREQRTLRAVSTWPWSADAIPTVVGAIVLPLFLSVFLSVIQQIFPR